LVAHAHDLGNGGHGQAVAVGGAYRLVALSPEILSGLFQRFFALGVVVSEGGQAGSGLGGLAFRSSYSRIV
jgi:hypothetical protein